MTQQRKKLGEILIEKGYIAPEQLNLALQEQQKKPDRFLGDILVKRKFIKERELAEVLSVQFTIPLIELKYKYLDWSFLGRFSPSLILDCKAIPVSETESHVTIAVNNPLDMNVLKKGIYLLF